MNIMEALQMNDNVLIENAILAFLHHYPNHEYAVPYAELLEKLRALKDEQPESAEVRKRGRPAQRQRKKETTSPASSKEAVESTEA